MTFISPSTATRVPRRRVIGLAALAPLGLLSGCSTPLPLTPIAASDPNAQARLRASAEAHGLTAYQRLRDINIAYDGQWRPFIDGIQPEVVDAGYRGSSQERLMPAAGIAAQSYTGPKGRKQVVWRRSPSARQGPELRGEIAVWRNGVPVAEEMQLDAAALVAEGYWLFLLGPLWLHGRGLPVRDAGSETVDGRECDVVELALSPGLGRVASDRVALCLDRRDGTMRRVRFTLEGFVNTRGAVAEVDTFEHERRFGVLWPMRSYERVIHPLRLPAHDWRVTGLDVDRGYAAADLAGPAFTGRAAAPAALLSTTVNRP